MRKTTARNYRNYFYKYYKATDNHSYIVPAGKCRCGKITDLYCIKCSKFFCEKHLFTDEEDFYCKDCKTSKCRALNKKEIRKIRKAKLDV